MRFSAPKLIETRAGFTLIELITVIGILGVLAVVLLSVLNPLTQFAKARDSQRRTILKQLQGALEQYYNDNGNYPSTGDAYYSSDGGDTFSNNGGAGGWIPNLAPKYIQALPADPTGGDTSCPTPAGNGTKKAFLYRSDGIQYALIACGVEVTQYLNNPKDSMFDQYGPRNSISWKVCMGDAACQTW
ncbi:MAG: type II secretion system protein [Candidatus Levyibacteriota bacterium]